MNHFKKKITLGFSISLLLLALACEKETVSTINSDVDISGQWDLQRVSNDIDIKNGQDTNNELNLSSQDLFFQFNKDGSYTTNVNIELGNISKADNLIEGNYEQSNNELLLGYAFEDFGISAQIRLEIAELEENTFVLRITEDTLFDAFDENIGNLGAIQKLLAQAYLDSLVELNTTIEMTR